MSEPTPPQAEDRPDSVIARRLRRRGRIAGDVAEYVRQGILTGTMRPGDKVDMELIATELDVSRSPIREALVILGQEGLVDLQPRRGATVADLTPDDVIDHYELVGLIGGRAAAMAAVELGEEDRNRLAEIHRAFEEGQELSPDELSELNDRFHRIINSAAPRRTRWLLALLARSVPSDFFEFTVGWNAQAVGHHAAILAAIVDRDPARARSAMEHHLHQSGVAASRELRSRGFWPDQPDSQSH